MAQTAFGGIIVKVLILMSRVLGLAQVRITGGNFKTTHKSTLSRGYIITLIIIEILCTPTYSLLVTTGYGPLSAFLIKTTFFAKGAILVTCHIVSLRHSGRVIDFILSSRCKPGINLFKTYLLCLGALIDLALNGIFLPFYYIISHSQITFNPLFMGCFDSLCYCVRILLEIQIIYCLGIVEEEIKTLNNAISRSGENHFEVVLSRRKPYLREYLTIHKRARLLNKIFNVPIFLLMWYFFGALTLSLYLVILAGREGGLNWPFIFTTRILCVFFEMFALLTPCESTTRAVSIVPLRCFYRHCHNYFLEPIFLAGKVLRLFRPEREKLHTRAKNTPCLSHSQPQNIVQI